MADTQPDKLSPLDEVRLDAEFNFKQRLREQEEKTRFEQEKAKLKQPSSDAPRK